MFEIQSVRGFGFGFILGKHTAGIHLNPAWQSLLSNGRVSPLPGTFVVIAEVA